MVQLFMNTKDRSRTKGNIFKQTTVKIPTFYGKVLTKKNEEQHERKGQEKKKQILGKKRSNPDGK